MPLLSAVTGAPSDQKQQPTPIDAVGFPVHTQRLAVAIMGFCSISLAVADEASKNLCHADSDGASLEGGG